MTRIDVQQMNLRHLRAFAQVVRRESISDAAEVVHMSQPAVTQAISGLENLFDQKFFIRSSKGMIPTETAMGFAARVDHAFDLLRKGVQSGEGPRGAELAYLLTSTQLRALFALRRSGSFSAAARLSGVSQPFLHRTARDLEALCQQPLFKRNARGITLTQAAQGLARHASLAFAELENAVDDITLQGAGKSASLRLGCLPLVRGTILPKALNILSQMHPNLTITVADSSYTEMLHALRFGELDILIGALRDPWTDKDTEQMPLFKDRLGIFCQPDHPLVGRTQISTQELARHPWVIAAKGAPTRAYFDRFFDGHPPSGPHIETNSLLLVRAMLEGSSRLTMISRTQLQADLRAKRLVELPVPLADAPRTIGITYRTDWRPTLAQQNFIGVLKDLTKR